MKTLNDSLIAEFDEALESIIQGDFDEVDHNILKRIYKELLSFKDDREHFDRSARTLVNTILKKDFKK